MVGRQTLSQTPPRCDLPQKMRNKTHDYKTLRDKKDSVGKPRCNCSHNHIYYPDVTSECHLWVGTAVAGSIPGAQGPRKDEDWNGVKCLDWASFSNRDLCSAAELDRRGDRLVQNWDGEEMQAMELVCILALPCIGCITLGKTGFMSWSCYLRTGIKKYNDT